jgi:hypothetical protein
MKMTNQERITDLAQSAKFKCRGLRGVTARNRIMTKLANLVQLASQPGSPLMSLFGPGGQYSSQRLGEQMIRNSGIDPSTLEKTQDEKNQEQAQQMVQDAMNQAQVTQPAPVGQNPNMPPAAGGPTAPAPNGGSPPGLIDASQDQIGTGADAMASKTPAGQVPAAPQPQMGGA